mgnify:CR=1 FL=1
MPTDRFEVRLPLKKLLIGLCLTLVPLCAVSLFTITQAGSAMRGAIGAHFKTIAGITASEIASFFNDRVIAVGALAADPTIVDAVTEANKRYAGASPDAIKDRILKMEKDWTTPAADAYVREMLSSRASRMLNRWREIDKRFIRITLSDVQGATIAATHKTLDYYQGDEDFWQAIYADGRGAVHMTDVLYDDVTKTYYIGLGVPVMEEGSNRYIGALDALIDVSTIFPLVHRIETGETMRAALVKKDGSIIYTPGVSLADKLRSEEFASVEEALQTSTGRQRGYVVTTLRSGVDTLIGYASPGLAASFPNLDWTVMVIQDARYAFSPTRGVMRLMWFSVAVAVVLMTFLAVFFALHRKPDYTDLISAQDEESTAARSQAA